MILSLEQKLKINAAAGASDFSSSVIHYTNLRNALSILNGQELWFGRIDQMNDATEYDHYFNAVRQIVPHFAPSYPAVIVDQLFAHFDSLLRDNVYISSWCEYFDEEPEGRKPMWMEYGDGGEGVAFVVDSSSFQPSALNEKKFEFFAQSTKVDYVKTDDINDLARRMIDRVRATGVFGKNPDEDLILATTLVAKSPTAKHHTFHEEREIRFLIMPKFRKTHNQFLPNNWSRNVDVDGVEKSYFAFKFQEWPEFDFDFRLSSILQKVLIGPRGDKFTRLNRITEALEQQGLGHVPVEFADIPMR